MGSLFSSSTEYGWSDLTIYLYFAIIVTSAFFAWISQLNLKISTENEIVVDGKLMSPEVSIRIIRFFFISLSFIILWFFSALRQVGIDYKTYQDIFLTSNNPVYLKIFGIEPGYFFLNRFIRLFTDSDIVFFAIIAFITNFLVYSTIMYFKKNLNVGMAIFVYSAMFYLQGFNLMRIYLASAIIFFAFRYIVEKKYIRFIGFILVAMTIHVSAICMFLPFIVMAIFRRSKILVLLSLVLFVFVSLYFSKYLILFNISERYTAYLMNTGFLGIGMGQIAMHAPVIALLFYTKKLNLDKHIMHIFFVFTFSSLAVALLGYGIPMVGRMSVYFTYSYILFIPYALKQLQHKKSNYGVVLILSILYVIWRLYLYLNQYLFLDGIMPYHNVFGWQF